MTYLQKKAATRTFFLFIMFSGDINLVFIHYQLLPESRSDGKPVLRDQPAN